MPYAKHQFAAVSAKQRDSKRTKCSVKGATATCVSLDAIMHILVESFILLNSEHDLYIFGKILLIKSIKRKLFVVFLFLFWYFFLVPFLVFFFVILPMSSVYVHYTNYQLPLHSVHWYELIICPSVECHNLRPFVVTANSFRPSVYHLRRYEWKMCMVFGSKIGVKNNTELTRHRLMIECLEWSVFEAIRIEKVKWKSRKLRKATNQQQMASVTYASII